MRGAKPKLKAIGSAKPTKVTKAPAWLSSYAGAEWRRVTPDLARRGVLTPESLATVESYCVAVGIVRECEAILQREGRIAQYSAGPGLHPSQKLQSQAIKDARALAVELGLTPSRRKPGDAPAPVDEWEGLLA